jgi:hypothetical protein
LTFRFIVALRGVSVPDGDLSKSGWYISASTAFDHRWRARYVPFLSVCVSKMGRVTYSMTTGLLAFEVLCCPPSIRGADET